MILNEQISSKKGFKSKGKLFLIIKLAFIQKLWIHLFIHNLRLKFSRA